MSAASCAIIWYTWSRKKIPCDCTTSIWFNFLKLRVQKPVSKFDVLFRMTLAQYFYCSPIFNLSCTKREFVSTSIFEYSKNTEEYGLKRSKHWWQLSFHLLKTSFVGGSQFKNIGYNGVAILNNSAVWWSCCKQSTVDPSRSGTEYVTMGKYCQKLKILL